MNIQDAMKPTGKAETDLSDSCYVQLNNEGILYWQCKVTKIGKRPVEFEYITDNIWQPYQEVKEIRPEKAGELWLCNSNALITYFKGDDLYFCNKHGVIGFFGKDTDMKHWTRLYPPVEDDSVERVEFNNIDWDLSECWQTKPMPFVSYDGGSKDWGGIRDAVINQPKMKMILEIPKD